MLDGLVLIAAFALAYLIRFDFAIPLTERSPLFIQAVPVVLIQFALLRLTGVYTFIWRYVGMAELKSFVKAAVYSAIPLLLLRLFLPEQFQSLRVPLSITVMDTVLAFGGVLGVRV
jgi:FlaA1/EpsC-like NDP-sugar epimerase